jgi:hypothetical protein
MSSLVDFIAFVMFRQMETIFKFSTFATETEVCIRDKISNTYKQNYDIFVPINIIMNVHNFWFIFIFGVIKILHYLIHIYVFKNENTDGMKL